MSQTAEFFTTMCESLKCVSIVTQKTCESHPNDVTQKCDLDLCVSRVSYTYV